MKRHNQREMRQLYNRWLESGQGKSVFATEHGIIRTTFYYWVKKFQRQDLIPSTSERARGFSLLSVQDNSIFSNRQAAVRVNFPSGITLDLYGTVEACFLKALTQ